jgi:cold shock protein
VCGQRLGINDRQTDSTSPKIVLYLFLFLSCNLFKLIFHVSCIQKKVTGETDMAFGIVKWFNNHKGFGFIESSEIGSDVFAHFSEVDMTGFKTLQQGASVVYEPMEGPRGWMAKNIKVIAAPAMESPSPLTNPMKGSRLRTPQFRANLIAQNA